MSGFYPCVWILTLCLDYCLVSALMLATFQLAASDCSDLCLSLESYVSIPGSDSFSAQVMICELRHWANNGNDVFRIWFDSNLLYATIMYMIIETIFFLPPECINIMLSWYDCLKCRLHFIWNSPLINYSFDLPAVLVILISVLVLELAGSILTKPNGNLVQLLVLDISSIKL